MAQTAPVFLTGFVTSQGLFLAKVCAAVARRVAAGAHRRVRRPGQARPGPVARRRQVDSRVRSRHDAGVSYARLSQRTLDSLPDTVARPATTGRRSPTGIVHFGVGGFHRAHQAMYLDRLMNEGKALDWGICGVGRAAAATAGCATRWTAQDGLYTLVVKHPDGRREPRVIGSIVAVPVRAATTRRRCSSGWPTRHAHRLADHHRGRLPRPPGRPASSTPSDPADPADLEPGAVPRTVVRVHHRGAGRRRREDGDPAVHGHVLRQHPGQRRRRAKQMIVAFARLKDPDARRLDRARRCAFPNSMVDRITPVTAPEDIARLADEFGVEDAWPVVCEPFTQWVLEDAFEAAAAGRRSRTPASSSSPDVEPYELMKLRLLNASHQALCYLGYLAGYRYAHEVCQDPLFVDFLLALHGPRGDADAARRARRRPRRLQAPAHRAVRQPRGARHPGPAVRRELRPHPEVAGAGHPDATSRRAARSSGRRSSSRRGRATPRASTSRASRSRSSTGSRTGSWPRPRDSRTTRWRSSQDRDLFGDLVDDERFAEALHEVAGLAARRRRPPTLERLAGRADSVHD